MNVLILNTVALNGGDGAILLALLDGLRAELGESARVVVHEAQPDVAARYYPDIAFHPSAAASLGRFPNTRAGALRRRAATGLLRLGARGGIAGAVARRALPAAARHVLDDYRRADVVITTGGTYLVEHYDLSGRVLSFEVALDAGKPLVFYTQSLGPFTRPGTRRVLERVLSRASLVFLRDALSRDHVIGLGGRADHLRVVPDSVFSLASRPRLAAAATATRPADRPLRVAVSVRDWAHFASRTPAEGMREYLAAVRAATVHLVERHGARVTFLSTCQGIPEYAHDDARTAAAIVDGLPPHVREAVTVDGRFHEPRQLVELLAGVDLVVSTRMHFAILSLISGVPVIPIAYEFKMRELFGHLGQSRWVHDIESVTAGELVASIDALLGAEGEVRAALFAAVADAHERAVAANAELGAFVRGQVGARTAGNGDLRPASDLRLASDPPPTAAR